MRNIRKVWKRCETCKGTGRTDRALFQDSPFPDPEKGDYVCFFCKGKGGGVAAYETCSECGKESFYFPEYDLCPFCYPVKCKPDCECGCNMQTCPCQNKAALTVQEGPMTYRVSNTGFAAVKPAFEERGWTQQPSPEGVLSLTKPAPIPTP